MFCLAICGKDRDYTGYGELVRKDVTHNVFIQTPFMSNSIVHKFLISYGNGVHL